MGSPSTPTPPKKDRNSRKTCGYCHKDFHEMSLKRHIKDVHFRNQNTYVICPQCCKQYASQNSLYSHLNRVHGVKKDMMPSAADLQMASAQQQQQQQQQHTPASSPSGSTASGVVSANSTPAPASAGQAGVGGGSNSNSSSAAAPTAAAVAATPASNNHHDGIMDLAHHSDNSN